MLPRIMLIKITETLLRVLDFLFLMKNTLISGQRTKILFKTLVQESEERAPCRVELQAFPMG